MNNQVAIQLLSDMLWEGLLIMGPVLIVALVVGSLISIVQAVTQIQETSLSFVPKLLAVIVTLIVVGHWMLLRLEALAIKFFSILTSL